MGRASVVPDVAGGKRPRVLVLGGGFAGIGAAQKLKKADVDVVLVDEHDYHTFQPLLYQLATGLLETTAVGHSLRDLVNKQDNATIHKAPITGDRPRGEGSPLRRSRAHHLRLPRPRARGARSTSSGRRALPSTRSRCTRCATRSGSRTTSSSAGRRRTRTAALVDDGALTVVVVGGGPTGVETAGAIAELYRSNFGKDYPSLPQEKARVVLVEAGDEIFAMFKPNLREYAKEALEKRTVEVMTGARVQSVVADARHARVGRGDLRAHARLGRRAAGQQSRPVARDRARAGQPDRRRTGPRAPRLSGGLRRRRHRGDHGLEDGAGAAAARLGRAPVGRARGRDDRPPRRGQVDEAVQVPDKGTMATIGRDAAVVQMLGGKTMKGRKAQFAWRTVHLALLPTNEDRAKAIVDWAGSRAHAPARGPDQRRRGRVDQGAERRWA